MAAETYPRLRLIRAGNPGWLEATPKNIGGTSAMLFSFGLPLHKQLDVPVGLIVGAVGGTPSGYWLSEEAFQSDAACKEVVAKFAKTYSLEQAKKIRAGPGEMGEGRCRGQAEGRETVARQAASAPRRPGECDGKVGNLYESRIRPFMPFAIRGVLWDQGESGTAILRRRSVHADGRPDPRLAQGVGAGRLPLPLRPEAQRRRLRLGPGRSGHLQGGKVRSAAGRKFPARPRASIARRTSASCSIRTRPW